MPNNINNKVTFRGDRGVVENILKKIKDGGRLVDFQKIIPTPKHILQVSMGTALENAYGEYACWNAWNRKNWGTKWNSYCSSDVDCEWNQVVFDTAWSPPVPIFRELSCWGVSLDVRVSGETHTPSVLVFEGGWAGMAGMPMPCKEFSDDGVEETQVPFTEEQWEEATTNAWRDLNRKRAPYIDEIASKLKEMEEEKSHD